MKKLAILIICIMAVFVLGCDSNSSAKISNNKHTLQKSTKGASESLELEIYFDSGEGKTSSVSKEERVLDTEEIIGEIIVNELIKGPGIKSTLKPVFPKDTKLISFSIKNNIAIVNLSKEAQSNMDVIKEEVCLKAIVSSLDKLDSINEILIQVESRSVKTFGGNFDISNPLKRGSEFTRIK